METPNYYAIIPAEVRYDERLTPNAKLLYGEIGALCNKQGYCWASNSYFAKLYKTTNVTVSRWFSTLQKAGYIETRIEYDKESKTVTKRYTKILGLNKNVKGGINKNVKGGINKNVKDNTGSNTGNNTSNIIDAFDPLIIEACKNITLLFKEDYRPKTKQAKLNWLKSLNDLNAKEKINPRQVYYIIKKTLEDDFWADNFRSPAKLLRNDKNGVKWVYVFKNKYAKDMQV